METSIKPFEDITFKGTFLKTDEFHRIHIYHKDTRFRKYKWFKWINILKGKPSPFFIGMRLGELTIPDDFKEGDQVEVVLSFVYCPVAHYTNRRIVFESMTLIG